jgi:hypothetical protein
VADLSTGRAEQALKGVAGSIMMEEGRPFVCMVLDIACWAHLVVSAMNKGVVAAPPRHRFGSAPELFGACQVPGPQSGR